MGITYAYELVSQRIDRKPGERMEADWAGHYGTAIVPVRVRRPKDKASVEGNVGHISTWITEALRKGTYFSVVELNGEIAKKLDDFNGRPFQKRHGSRTSVFIEEERDFLLPLPLTPFEIASWKKATVAFNYHICVSGQYYSVPYEYIKHQVDVRLTSRMVEVFYNGVRICSHPRLTGGIGQYRTTEDHMPPSHRKAGEWSTERFTSWARSMGPNTVEVIYSLLSRHKVEQQGYRSCMGVLKMADKYSVERLEAACAKALSYTPHPTHKNISAILQSGQDKVKTPKAPERRCDDAYSFVRGPKYYGGASDAE